MSYKPETKLVHDTKQKSRFDKLINPAICRASTFVFDNYEEFLEVEKTGFSDKSYGRSGTSTVHHLGNIIAELDDVAHAIITPSGISAITTALLSFLNSGDSVLVPDNVYICTRRFLDEEFKKLNIEVIYYDPEIGEEITKLFKKNTKVLFLESPGSGTYEIQDIPLLTKVAHKHGVTAILDNSWATSLNFQPFKHGVDVAIQSLTKYASGHSDVFLGAITMKDKLYKKIYETFRNYGAVPSPDDCYLVHRGIRTLAIRLKEQSQSALKIAKWLEAHPKVEKVLYPALPSFKHHNLWKRDFIGASATFSFIIKKVAEKEIHKFVNSLQLFGIGLSWGGYESLIMPMNIAKYRSVTGYNYSGTCIRIHIGLEKYEDLIIDLEKNMKKIKPQNK
jgi:cystathionine beta-lyase